MTKHTVRASSLSTFHDCPRRWAARQIPEIVRGLGYSLNKVGRHIGAATGQATHQGAMCGTRARIKSGKYDGEEMDDIAIMTLRSETEGEVIWDDRSPNLNVAEQQVIRQVGVFRESILPDDDSEWIEPAWKGVHHTGLIVTGHPDFVRYAGIKDLKTGIEGDNAAQYGVYAMLAEVADEVTQVDAIEELFIPRSRITEAAPAVERIPYDLDGCKNRADGILTHISRSLDSLELDGRNAFPANTHSMLCSSKFCPAWGTGFCPESTLRKT